VEQLAGPADGLDPISPRPHALTCEAPEDRLPDAGPTPEAVRPGALSALLEEIVRAPGSDAAWQRELAAGDVVGRFEILREIGRGGFGVVYEARDAQLGRRVAFKAVRAGDQAALREERLQREAESAARLSHPSIVTLHDVGRCEQGPYLVLELLRGQSLGQRLAQGPLSVREALRVATRVAEGLAHAHARGVVHRDLTPGNVFLCDDGQVKVLDFGLAHAFGQPRIAGGTPGYMAPEQWRGAPEDERTDVFALGVMLYRMMSGALPFPEDGGRSATGPQPAPALEVSGAPAVGALVSRMLEKDPVRRPRDGGEVLAALAAFEQELGRTPSDPAAQVRPHPRRRRLAWAAAGALALCGLAVAGVLLVRARAPGPPQPPMTVAVADFANRTGEPDLDGLSGMLITSLEQSQRLSVLTRVRMVDLLRQLGRTEVESVDEALGREVALAAGARALVLATIRRFDQVYAIEVKVLDPARSEYLFTLQEEGRGKASIPAMIDALSARARERLRGETPAEVEASSVRVADATTASFEAYQHYFRGDQLKETIRYAEAIAEYRKALAIDPGFALAHWRIAYLGEFTAMETAERRAEMALALRGVDRVPAKERLLFQAWKAHLDDRNEEAHGLYARAVEAYPQDKEVLFLAGDIYLHEDRPEEGLPLFQRAAALDPTYTPALMHVVDSLLHLGRFQELDRVAREWVARSPTAAAYWALCYAEGLAGDLDKAVAAAQRSYELDGTPASRSHYAGALIQAERYADAEALLRPSTAPGASRYERNSAWWELIGAVAYQGRRGEALRLIEELPEEWMEMPGARAAMRFELFLGDADPGPALAEARRFVQAGGKLKHEAILPVGLVLLGAPDEAARVAGQLPPNGAMRTVYEAAAAWRAGNPERALAALREAARRPEFEARPVALFLLAHVAFEQKSYREVMEAADGLRLLPSGLWRAWGYPKVLFLEARAQEATGDVPGARRTLDRILAGWANADRDLSLAREVKSMRRRLGPGS
jgi:tetratricopeptide (TPR) repeat protein